MSAPQTPAGADAPACEGATEREATEGEPETTARERELSRGLRAVRERIAAACAQAGRDPGEVSLVVVTKFFPATDVAALVRLGVRDVGENKAQEALAKRDELAAILAGQAPPRLHFIGQLQTNKAGAVARCADVIHSVDRERLARALERALDRAPDHAPDHGEEPRTVEVLLQVNLDDDAEAAQGRGGVAPAQVARLGDLVASLPHLRLRGVMGVAPRGGEPAAAFARLAQIGATLRASHPDADLMSAGMSGDLEAAVAAGATHLRVGSAILGSRPSHG